MADIEELELITHFDDLPKKGVSTRTEDKKSKTPMQIAYEFTLKLVQAYKDKKTEDLKMLYDYEFNALSNEIFKQDSWPTIESIENQYSIDVPMFVNQLYYELFYRHLFARCASSVTPQLRFDSWSNYLGIFQDIINDTKNAITLPPQWIWDIYDEFIYQFQTFCQFRAKIKDETDTNYQEYKESSDIPCLVEIEKILTHLLNLGNVIKNGRAECAPEPTTRQYFSYFAVVAYLRLYVLIADFDKAIDTIKVIGHNTLQIYSRSYPGLINLFYYAGSAYFMTGRYVEAGKLFKAILSYQLRYKTFYTMTFQHEATIRLAERELYMLSLCNLFAQLNLGDFISQITLDIFGNKDQNFMERLTEKQVRLQRNDVQVISEFFMLGCPKMIIPLTTCEDWVNFGFDKNIFDVSNQEKEKIIELSQKLLSINDLASILRLYTSITIEKLMKILKVDKKGCEDLLSTYQLKRKITLKENPFEQEILAKILKDIKSVSFVRKNDELTIVDESRSGNMVKVIEQNIKKLDAIIKELGEIQN